MSQGLHTHRVLHRRFNRDHPWDRHSAVRPFMPRTLNEAFGEGARLTIEPDPERLVGGVLRWGALVLVLLLASGVISL